MRATGDLDFPAGAHVDDRVSLAQGALINADVGELAVGAIFEFEGQGDQGGLGVLSSRTVASSRSMSSA